MPGPSDGTLLWNNKSDQPEFVATDRINDALKSGTYRTYDASGVRPAGTGGITPLKSGGLGDLQAKLPVDSGVEQTSEAAKAAYQAQWEGAANSANAFAQAVVDAASFGLIVSHTEQDKAIREAHQAAGIAGNIVGTAATLGLSAPGKVLVGVGETIGKLAARGLVRGLEGTAANIARRGITEAATGAIISTVTATNHQIGDAIIENKAVSAEAVAHEAGLGALMGFGFGAAGGVLKAVGKASRAAVVGQGGVLDVSSPQAAELVGHYKDAVAAYGKALDDHSSKLYVMKALVAEGYPVSAGMVQGREAAIRAAQKAYDHLNSFDVESVLGGKGAAGLKKYHALQDAYDAFQSHVEGLDSLMEARPGEGLPRPGEVTHDVTDGQVLDEQATPEARRQSMADELKGGRLDDAEMAHQAALQPPEGNYGPTEDPWHGSEEVFPAGKDMESPWSLGKPSNEELQAYRERQGNFKDNIPDPEEMAASRRKEVFKDYTAGRAGRALDDFLGSMPKGVVEPHIAGEGNPLLPRGGLGKVKADSWGKFNEGAAEAHAADAYDASNLKTQVGEPTVPLRQLNPQPTVITPETNAKLLADVVNKPIVGEPTTAGGSPKDNLATPTTETVEPARGGNVKDQNRQWFKDAMPEGAKEVTPEIEAAERMAADAGPHKWINDWVNASQGAERVRPGDVASAHMKAAIDGMTNVAGIHLDAAGGLDPANLLGIKRAGTSMGERLQQIYAMRQLANMAADVSRGVELPASIGGKVAAWVTKRAASKAGAAILGGLVGSHFGGPLGFYIGSQLVGNSTKAIGQAAAAAGRLAVKVSAAGAGLLAGGRSVAIARGVTGNIAHQYDDEGPIQDPIERFQKVQALAKNQVALEAAAWRQVGELKYTAPDVAQGIVDHAIRRITAIALRAPAFVWDRLGRVIQPPSSKMRQATEFENAANDLDSILDSIKAGSASKCQVDALKMCYPESHAAIVKQILGEQEAITKASAERQAVIELVLGTRVGSKADPFSVLRGQMTWVQHNQMQAQAVEGQGQAPNSGTGKAQAFKMTTPSQAPGTGRAPGN